MPNRPKGQPLLAPLLCALSILLAAAPAATASGQTQDIPAGFIALAPIDAHTHILRSDPAFTAMLQRLNLHVLDILVIDAKDTAAQPLLEEQKQAAWSFLADNPGRASLSTNFNPFLPGQKSFPQTATAELNRDFARGAVAATIWTNPGMAVKDASGNPVAADDPRFEAIYKDMARHHRTFVAHLSGLDEAWRPADAPDPAAQPPILTVRDNILRQNPTLRVLAAHLGGEKYTLAQASALLDRNPNLAVDTSGRLDFLLTQPRDQVLAFFDRYQDRILYGSDLGFRAPDGAPAQVVEKWQTRYARDWRLLATADAFDEKGKQVQGLNLPQPILKKLFHDNALRWLPNQAH